MLSTITFEILFISMFNRIGSVMVSVLASNLVDRGFEPWSGQAKDYKIGICRFSAKPAALRRKFVTEMLITMRS